jgi:Cellulase (glycosyl hydrolase family 5)
MMKNLLAAGVLATTSTLIAVPAAAGTGAAHRIAANADSLYDTVTGEPFVPRGADYVRLAAGSHGGAFHSTFEPGRYSAQDAQTVLDNLKNASGYNTVRMFIDPGDGYFTNGLDTDPGSDGLNPAYLDNVADFVERAAADGIYVLPALSAWPVSPYYTEIFETTDHGTPNPDVSGDNQWFMDSGFIAAKKAYLRNFVADLHRRVGDDITAVLAYETENEAFWEASQKPFSTMSGTLTGPDGLTYDMSKSADRQQAADASMVVYQNAAADGVHASDPQAMVTIGFFTNQAVGKPGYDGFATHCATDCQPGRDYRYPGRPASIARWSDTDFVDIHAYPQGGGYSLGADLDTVEISGVSKPYVMAEFGAYKPAYHGDITAAAYDMRDKQVQSCSVGRGAKGWIFWTYDTDVVDPGLASQDQFYSLADDRGAINGQLAPVVRPDPCKP